MHFERSAGDGELRTRVFWHLSGGSIWEYHEWGGAEYNDDVVELEFVERSDDGGVEDEEEGGVAGERRWNGEWTDDGEERRGVFEEDVKSA